MAGDKQAFLSEDMAPSCPRPDQLEEVRAQLRTSDEAGSLLVKLDGGVCHRYPLYTGVNIIGRACKHADEESRRISSWQAEEPPGRPAVHGVMLPIQTISKRHARLDMEPPNSAGVALLHLTDLNSSNGTYLCRGGREFRCNPGVKHGIVDGDIIRLSNISATVALRAPHTVGGSAAAGFPSNGTRAEGGNRAGACKDLRPDAGWGHDGEDLSHRAEADAVPVSGGRGTEDRGGHADGPGGKGIGNYHTPPRPRVAAGREVADEAGKPQPEAETASIPQNFAQDLDNVFGHYTESAESLEQLERLHHAKSARAAESSSSQSLSQSLEDLEVTITKSMETLADDYGFKLVNMVRTLVLRGWGCPSRTAVLQLMTIVANHEVHRSGLISVQAAGLLEDLGNMFPAVVVDKGCKGSVPELRAQDCPLEPRLIAEVPRWAFVLEEGGGGRVEQLDYWDVFLRLCDWALQGFEANCSAWRRRWEGSILMLKTISGFLMRDHGSRMDAFWASAGRLDDTTREKMITSSLLGGLLAAGKELHRSRGLQDLVEALVALSARRGAAECSGDGTYEVHLNDVGRSLLNLVLRHYDALESISKHGETASQKMAGCPANLRAQADKWMAAAQQRLLGSAEEKSSLLSSILPSARVRLISYVILSSEEKMGEGSPTCAPGPMDRHLFGLSLQTLGRISRSPQAAACGFGTIEALAFATSMLIQGAQSLVRAEEQANGLLASLRSAAGEAISSILRDCRPSLSQAAVIRLVISRVSTALPPTEESPAAAAGPRYQRGRGRGQLESRMPPFRASGEACGRKANQGTHQDAAAPNSSPGVSDASRTKVNGHSCKGQSSDIDQRSRAQTRDDTYDRAVPKATRAQGPPDSGAGARAAECSGAEDASDGGGNGTAASIGQANKAASTPANRVLPGDIPFERAGVGPGGRSGPQRENLGGDDAQCGPADNAVGDGEAFPTCQQATGPGVSDLSMGRKPSGMGGIVEEEEEPQSRKRTMRGDASEEVEGSTSRHIQATPARAPGERRPNGACGDAAGSKRRRSVQRHSLGADSDPPASAVCGFEPPNGSALVRGRAAPVRVAFSTCIGEVLLRKHKQVVEDLGGEVCPVDSLDFTHFVTMKGREEDGKGFIRSFKMMLALAGGMPIVDEMWLEACRWGGRFLPPDEHLLRDPVAEKKHNFCMADTFRRSQRSLVFEKTQVLFTPAFLVQEEDRGARVKALVAAGGGAVISTVPQELRKRSARDADLRGDDAATLIVGLRSDREWASMVLKPGVPVWGREHLLKMIMRHEPPSDPHAFLMDPHASCLWTTLQE